MSDRLVEAYNANENGSSGPAESFAANAGVLAGYLPDFLVNIRDLGQVLQVEQPYFQQAWQAVGQALAEQYILGAGEWGLGRWEQLLHLEAPESLSLDERRQALLLRLNEQLPFTVIRLRELLAAAAPAGQYTMVLDEKNYVLHVYITLAAKGCLPALRALLQRVAPANLSLHLQLMFNTHGKLAKFTHQQLSQWSCWAIREEVLD